jgi:hypothetical protein
MSALWSLTGGKQTWGEPSISVAIDPQRTSRKFYRTHFPGRVSADNLPGPVNLNQGENHAKANSYGNGRSRNSFGELNGLDGERRDSYWERNSECSKKLLADPRNCLPRIRALVWTGLYQSLWSIPMLVPSLFIRAHKSGGHQISAVFAFNLNQAFERGEPVTVFRPSADTPTDSFSGPWTH